MHHWRHQGDLARQILLDWQRIRGPFAVRRDKTPNAADMNTSAGRADLAKQIKAVFLDRDGTIIADAHYLSDPTGVMLLPKAAEALAILQSAGFGLFLLTNQSGVGRGLFSLDAVHRCNQRMIDLLNLPKAPFVEICIAPETPDQPVTYRKPSPRFIDECVAKYGLDRACSWMVGDKASDVETGRNARINAAIIGAAGPIPWVPPVPRYDSLHHFACSITGLK